MKSYEKFKTNNNNNNQDNNNTNQDNNTVLFVCVENARSQIAEGFFKKYASKWLSPKCRNSLEVREIRDEIEERIKELVAEITTITPTER